MFSLQKNHSSREGILTVIFLIFFFFHCYLFLSFSVLSFFYSYYSPLPYFYYNIHICLLFFSSKILFRFFFLITRFSYVAFLCSILCSFLCNPVFLNDFMPFHIFLLCAPTVFGFCFFVNPPFNFLPIFTTSSLFSLPFSDFYPTNMP